MTVNRAYRLRRRPEGDLADGDLELVSEEIPELREGQALVRNRLGQPVGTGRLLQDSAGVARIGRMAALHPLRGAGIGQAVMAALVQAARDRGDTQVVLSAQRSAEDFYRRLGYAPNGEPYEEVGIAHIPMARSLVV